jgi:hypothetical protein
MNSNERVARGTETADEIRAAQVPGERPSSQRRYTYEAPELSDLGDLVSNTLGGAAGQDDDPGGFSMNG